MVLLAIIFALGIIIGSFLSYYLLARVNAMSLKIRKLEKRLSEIEESFETTVERGYKVIDETLPAESGKSHAASQVPVQDDGVEGTGDPQKPYSGSLYAKKIAESSENTATERQIPPVKKVSVRRRRSKAPRKSLSERFAFSQTITSLITFVKGGNIWVAAGIVFVVLGVTFGYLYVNARYHIPGELKVCCGIIFGFLLFMFGWRQRKIRQVFGLVLQGGGISIIYLSLFASVKIYAVAGIVPVFILMGTLVAVSSVLSVYQDSQPMAVFSTIIGFAVPLLLSTGSGNYIVLFSYYILLNAGVLYIATIKYWRYLNAAAFFATAAVGIYWGLHNRGFEVLYVQLFLVAFFIIFTAINILSSFKQPEFKLENAYAVTTSFTFTACQMWLCGWMDFKYSKGVACLALGIFYFILCFALGKKYRSRIKTLVELYLTLSIIFVNLSLVLTLDDKYTAVIWAVEGAVLVVLGHIQKNRYFRLMGNILVLLSCYLGISQFINYRTYFISALIPALAVPAVAVSYHKFRYKFSGLYSTLLLFVSFVLLWAVFSNKFSFEKFSLKDTHVLSISITCFILCAVGGAFRWRAACAFCFAPVITVLFANMPIFSHIFFFVHVKHLYLIGTSATLVFLALQLACIIPYTLYADRLVFGDATFESFLKKRWAALELLYHTFVAGLLVILLSLLLNRFSEYPFLPVMAMGIAVVAICNLPDFKGLSRYITAYKKWSCMLIVAYMVCFLNYRNYSYIPADFGGFAVLVVFVYWYAFMRRKLKISYGKVMNSILAVFAGVEIFCWLHVMLGRITVQFFGAAHYSFYYLYRMPLYQLEIALLWGISGFGVMLAANRMQKRLYWVLGAVLFAMDAVKLMFIDLSKAGTLPRIGSFMMVGLLMIAIGYFVPLPPKKNNIDEVAL